MMMWGCSNSNADAPVPHPFNQQWVSDHGDVFINSSDQCRVCHGPNLLEGASAFGCGKPMHKLPNGQVVGCHGSAGPFGHDVKGFLDPSSVGPGDDPLYAYLGFHGNFAKGVPKMDPAAPFGFEKCTDCHNEDFTGRTFPGPEGGEVTSGDCFPCHGIDAPHSTPDQWRTNHQMTDPANGETCVVCHLPGVPEAGCFTGICHLQKPATHPDPWPDHGSFAMQAPAPGEPPTGFLTCNGCHGSKFSGNANNNAPACQSCHGINAPHPDGDEWEAEHTATDQRNALVCAWCHRGKSENPNFTDPRVVSIIRFAMGPNRST